MPTRGLQYPGSYAELRAWFPDDEACMDYLGWLRTFLTATVEPGSTVVSDGLASYPTACRDRFTHEPHPVFGSGQQAKSL